jgi:hypothetical protein
MTVAGKKLKALGFKKIPGTGPGFHMYELTPSQLDGIKVELKNIIVNKRASKRTSKLDK